MIKYTTKRLDDLSLNTINKLMELSFGEGGGMHDQISKYKMYRENKDKKSKHWTAIFAKDDSTFIGWSLIKKSYHDSHAMYYVNNSHRRMGVGTQLFNRSRNYLLKTKKSEYISVFPHDFKSSKFFRILAEKHEDVHLDVWSS